MSSNKKCLKCKYNGSLRNRTYTAKLKVILEHTYCNYIGITGIKRPCKAGKDCTVYEPKRNKKGRVNNG